ncbi:glutaredoxin family protein [Peribacillus huizhouensis]|uniref:Glutaredoxin n=1 Tax=Peribacillus huizhouensis TaxID=1501239 RepID=A0ABR6CP49_9BACI|nr:glutaredoxin family protein [Peribacillus huizhouensis]MBA9026808.1 glutaredoxin [Peribacillus huizhouensis]
MLPKEWNLYTRSNCPLCDKAKVILERIKQDTSIDYREIDIYTNDALIERFGLMIPVIEWQGEIVQYGQIDEMKLRQLCMEDMGRV